MKTIWLAALLGALRPAGAQEGPAASASAEAWLADPSGWLFITRASVGGTATRIHEGDEFRLDRGFVPVLRAGAALSETDGLGFRLVPIELEGDSTVPEDYRFHGTTYPAGRRVGARLRLTITELDYRRTWPLDDGVRLTSRLGLEAWRFSARLRTEDALPRISERRSFSSLYWLAGAGLEASLGAGLEARLSAAGGLNEHHKHFLELEAGTSGRPLPGVALTAGWRFHLLRFDHVTNEGNLLFSGPFAGIDISF